MKMIFSNNKVWELIQTISQKFGVDKIFFFVPYDHKGCIYLIKNTVKK